MNFYKLLNDYKRLLECSKNVKTYLIDTITSNRKTHIYHNDEFKSITSIDYNAYRKVGEVKIDPLIFISESSDFNKSRMSDIIISDDDNTKINEYFVKYLNNNKDHIWKEIYKYMVDDLKNNRKSILDDLDNFKNELENI